MKTLCGLVLGLLLLASGTMPAEPPKQGRELTAEEQKEVARLELQVGRLGSAGQFEEALKTAKRTAAYRAERQGASHWQSLDARMDVERWQRLIGLPEKDQAQVARALAAVIQGSQLQEVQRFREAEAKWREALTICQKVLGERHPETARCYNSLAFCLDGQGKYAEALPLFR